MSSLLIDSHILLYLLYEPERLGVQAKESIRNADSVYISTASLWELSIKFTKGKLSYTPQTLVEGYKVLNLSILPILESHVLLVDSIVLPHKDPFDTMLVAQSVAEDVPLITADSILLSSKYQTLNATI